MFVKKLDYLSPKVTFYHKGLISHASILSGILSIIFYIIKLILALYYSLELIQRKDLKAFYYHSFIEDAPTFPLNSSSLFHFIALEKRKRQSIYEGIDFTKFRIIGFEAYFDNIIHNSILFERTSHWLYGNCDSNDIKGINYLINYDFFEKSACIKKYFDSKEGKYFNIGEPKFKWPVMAHGTNNANNQFYSIYMGKCQENTLNLILGEGYNCKNDSEIDEYFNTNEAKVLNFYFVDNYVNILNYKSPFSKYIYKIENPLYQNEYSINNINFNPLTLKTNNGLIFNNVEQEISYIFQRNDVYISETKEKDIYSAYCIWLKNTNYYYERTYKKIQDIFSSIGGINHIINIVAILLNRLYNKFIVLCDTEKLLLSLVDLERINSKNDIKKKIKNLREASINNNIKKSTERIKFNTKDMIENISEKNKSEITLSKTNNNIFLNSYNIPDKIQKILIDDENQNINKIAINNSVKKGNNFFDFILLQLTCGKKNNKLKVYDRFRKRIISEEAFIKNHLNIFNLLTAKEKKKLFKRSNHQMKNHIQ